MDTETRKERDGKRKKNIQKYIGRRKSETKKSDAVALFVEDPCKESVVLEQSRYFTLYLYWCEYCAHTCRSATEFMPHCLTFFGPFWGNFAELPQLLHMVTFCPPLLHMKHQCRRFCGRPIIWDAFLTDIQMSLPKLSIGRKNSAETFAISRIYYEEYLTCD